MKFPTYKNFDIIKYNMEKDLIKALINSLQNTNMVHPTLVIGVLEKILIGYHIIEKEINNIQNVLNKLMEK